MAIDPATAIALGSAFLGYKSSKDANKQVEAQNELLKQQYEWEKSKEVPGAVSYTHLRAHETPEHLVCRLLLEKKK